MKWIKYQIHTTTDNIDKMSLILNEIGMDSYEIQDNIPVSIEDQKKMYTDISVQQPDDGKVTFIIYSTEDESATAMYSTGSSIRDKDPVLTYFMADAEKTMEKLNSKLKEYFNCESDKIPLIEYIIEDDSEWKDKYKESIKAFRISDDIVVKPVWEENSSLIEEKDKVIIINPGMAFGTGMHETTRLCIKAIENNIVEGCSMIDIGCGSGILSIAAILKGAGHAALIDIDESAVDTISETMELNDIPNDKYVAGRADILSDKGYVEKLCGEEFDMVVANILADVIVPLCPIVKSFMKKDSVFISSGILEEKSYMVKEALEENGYEIIEVNRINEWVSFTAKVK